MPTLLQTPATPEPPPQITDPDEAFAVWKKDPNPTHGTQLLKSLQPTIDHGLRRYAGSTPSSADRAAAKTIALQAAQSYQPGRSSLRTHVGNHMQSLQRIRGKRFNLLKIPERTLLERTALQKREVELEDQLGRAPSGQELSDYAGLPLSRIEKLQEIPQAANSGFFSASNDPEQGGSDPAVVRDEQKSIVQAVYYDLDPINQAILEYSMGIHGKRPLSNQDIAAKLKISPSAVSQRKVVIQQALDQLEDIGVLS